MDFSSPTAGSISELDRLRELFRSTREPASEVELERLVEEWQVWETVRASGKNEAAPLICNLRKAIRVLQDWSAGRLDHGRLAELNCLLTGTQRVRWRRQAVAPLCPYHEPMPAERVEKALQRFLEWVASPSFTELHPVVQMTLAQIRLLEIVPFARFSETSACLSAAGLLVGAGYLLPQRHPEELKEFYTSLSSAFQLSTEPLLRLNLRGCLRSYRSLLGPQVGMEM